MTDFVPSVNLPSGGLAYSFDGHLGHFISSTDEKGIFEGYTFCNIEIIKSMTVVIIRWDAKPIQVCSKCFKLWEDWGNQVNAYILVKEEETK